MNIAYNYKTAAVLRDLILNKLTDLYAEKKLSLYVIVKCYQNGREQGFIIWTFVVGRTGDRTVIFSENRNSDEIVVYKGNTIPPHEGLGGSKEFWNGRKYFPPEAVQRAADYCVEFLSEVVDTRN